MNFCFFLVLLIVFIFYLLVFLLLVFDLGRR